MVVAQGGINKLRENVDTLLVIPNEKLLSISEKSLTLCDAFELADSVLKDTICGISNIVYNCGNINIDYNDVKTTLENKGTVKQAVNCPLLETDIAGAVNILINTSGQICLKDLDDALNYIRELAGEEVNIIWGTVSEEESDKIVVSLFATGMPEKEVRHTALGEHMDNPNRNNIAPKRDDTEVIQIPPFLKRHSIR